MQTASWQQALAGADTAVDEAIAALNLNNSQGWTNWKKVTSSQLPTSQPSGGATATTAPDSGKYNYLVSTTPLARPTPGALPEGNTTGVTWWATVDTAGLDATKDANGNQWYRIRGTGVAGVPGPPRVSNNRLDNDLRKLSLFLSRQTGSTISSPQASRTIEVVVQPIATGTWARGVTTRTWMSMAGDRNNLIALVDSFDSSNLAKSTLGLYDIVKRQSHGDLAMVDSTKADLGNTYVYGNLTYNGPTVANATAWNGNNGTIFGNIATPFNYTIPDTADPTWTPGTYTTYAGGSVLPLLIVTAGPKANPVRIKINGDFTVPAGQTLTILNQDASMTNNYIEFWVTGKFTTLPGGLPGGIIVQSPLVHATWYVDNDITVNGASYLVTRAENLGFVGVGNNHTVTEAGILPFIGTFNAPGFDVKISGVGGFSGAILANTLTLNNLGSIHYDEALKGLTSNTVGSYAFASWFEDNSDKVRSISY